MTAAAAVATTAAAATAVSTKNHKVCSCNIFVSRSCKCGIMHCDFDFLLFLFVRLQNNANVGGWFSRFFNATICTSTTSRLLSKKCTR